MSQRGTLAVLTMVVLVVGTGIAVSIAREAYGPAAIGVVALWIILGYLKRVMAMPARPQEESGESQSRPYREGEAYEDAVRDALNE